MQVSKMNIIITGDLKPLPVCSHRVQEIGNDRGVEHFKQNKRDILTSLMWLMACCVAVINLMY